MNTNIESILRDLDLPPTSSKIYQELLENGEATARLLSDRLRITRPSTYDHLAILKQKGLIIERKIDNKMFFAIDDVRTVKQALNEKISTLTEHEKLFTSMLPELIKQTKTEVPVIKFFEGTKGLSYIIHDLLYSKGETVYTMWPHEEMMKVIDTETLIRFNEKRIRDKIILHTLWPKSMAVKGENIWKDKDILIVRKFLPKGMEWTMGYTIYGDRVSFIASHKEVFGFIVYSKEFAALMKLQFSVLWQIAKEK